MTERQEAVAHLFRARVQGHRRQARRDEVASLALGDQIAAEWLPLLGISYDPKDDIIHTTLDGLDHIIRAPREVYVDLGPTGLTSTEIVDTGDVRQIVQLRDPLALPAPSSASG